MPAISVIIPAYNAKDYIRTCLDSVLQQTFQDFEIIAVNDGSKDNTLDILNEYKEKHPEKLHVISQENQGLSVTRNNGAAAAKGEYIFFLDSDDYLKKETFALMYNKAKEHNSDMVCCNVDLIYPDKVVGVSAKVTARSQQLTLEEKKTLFSMYPIVCNKLYKREIFTKLQMRFLSGIWFEDVLFNTTLIPYLNSVDYVQEYLYEYLQRPTSITYTYSDKLRDFHTVLEKTMEFYQSHGLFEDYKDELEYMYARYMFATYIKRLSKAKDLKRFRQGIAFARREVTSHFPNYRKNPYITAGGAKSLYLKYFNPLLAYAIFVVERNRMN